MGLKIVKIKAGASLPATQKGTTQTSSHPKLGPGHTRRSNYDTEYKGISSAHPKSGPGKYVPKGQKTYGKTYKE